MTEIAMGAIPAVNAARRGTDSVALKHGEDIVTWGELDRRSTQRAWALKAAGVRKDDFVTIALPTGSVFYELTFALWKLGATPHVVSWRLPQRELASILEVATPRLVVASSPELISAFDALDPSVSLRAECDDTLPPAVATYWKAMSSGGSTGRPKIIVADVPSVFDPDVPFLSIPRDSVILNPGPLYHNAPFLFTHLALFKGNAVVGMLKFDAEAALRLVVENHVEWVSFVPTMMLRIWRLPLEVRERYDVSSLKTVWHVAAPMPPWLKEAWINWLGPERIWELYGGTEGQGWTVISGAEWLEHRGSVGLPAGCELQILDESGQPVAPGEVGEIFLRPAGGAPATYHYMGSEARRAGAGFESLGDFGWLDQSGYLYLADRRTDMILSGGANIYPAEVEAALMEHPGVEVAVVIGLPHEDLGAAVHAIVKLHPEWVKRVDQTLLATFVGERLARYKTPRSYEFTTLELRDDAGKVRRIQLRDERMTTQRPRASCDEL